MPTPLVTKLATEYNTDVSTVDKYWSQAKKLAKKSYAKEDDKYWGTVTTIVKNKLKANEEVILEEALVENAALLSKILLKQSSKMAAGIGPAALKKTIQIAIAKKLASNVATKILTAVLGATAFAKAHPFQAATIAITNGIGFITFINTGKQRALAAKMKAQEDKDRRAAVKWYSRHPKGKRVFRDLEKRVIDLKAKHFNAVRAKDAKKVAEVNEEIEKYNKEAAALMDIAYQLYLYEKQNMDETTRIKYAAGQLSITEAANS